MFLYQYGNEANPTAHLTGTGPEILRDVPDITHFVAGLGTSGTLMGVGTYLKEHKPDGQDLRGRAAEWRDGRGSAQASMTATCPRSSRSGAGMDLLDGKRIVRPIESLEWTRRLVGEAGSSPASSSGAAMAGAVKVAERIDEGVIVFVVSDGGWKYLSTGAYSGDLAESADALGSVIYF